MDRRVFYGGVRAKLGALKQDQVDGFERYLYEGERRGTPLDRLAYIIATVFWETARTMQPVKEASWKNEAWRMGNLRYFPWYGRGDVQLTWEANYRKAGDAIGVDLIKNPDLALVPANAVKIAFEGLEQGWFTGKSLSDYLDGVDESDDEDLREFANARRVVNGTDKQIEIGKIALIFEHALRAGGYSGMPGKNPIIRPETILLPETASVPAPSPVGHNRGPALEPVVTAKPLTPIEQMNKPVTGATVGTGVTMLIGAPWRFLCHRQAGCLTPGRKAHRRSRSAWWSAGPSLRWATSLELTKRATCGSCQGRRSRKYDHDPDASLAAGGGVEVAQADLSRSQVRMGLRRRPFRLRVVLVINADIMSQQQAYAAMLRFADQSSWMWALMVLSCGRLIALGINGSWHSSPHMRAFFAFLAGFAWWQIFAGFAGNAGFGLVFAAGFFVLDAFNFRQALIEAFVAEGVREVVRRNASSPE